METEGSLPHSQAPAICPYPKPRQSSPCSHPTSWRLILILSFQLCLVLPSGLFPQQNPVYTSPFPIRCTLPAHLILLDLINRIIFYEEYRSLSSSLRSFLHSPCYLVHLRPKFLLSSLYSNTLSLCSSLILRDQFPHPYTTGKIIFLYISIFIFLYSKLEDKRFCTEL